MVDAKFISRVANFVPYPLLRDIAAGHVIPSTGIEYIGEEGMKVIEGIFFCFMTWLELAWLEPFCIQTWIWCIADV
jgi:hypothetical protein